MKSQPIKKSKNKPIYMHFPSKFSEEELMLQSKYQKLRKKKRAIQKQKAPPIPEPEPVPVKRPKSPKIEARDAREIAKKLIKSGAIAIVKTPTQGNEGFKRPLGLERRSTAAITEKTVHSYQPFSATALECEPKPEPTYPKVKSLYESFQPASNTTERKTKIFGEVKQVKKGGNTIYVNAEDITEEMMRNTFSKFGSIVNITIEDPKHHGFLTFETSESADKAIHEMDDKYVNNIYLKVSLARKQHPGLSHFNRIPSNSRHQSTAHKDSRELIVYDDLFF